MGGRNLQAKISRQHNQTMLASRLSRRNICPPSGAASCSLKLKPPTIRMRRSQDFSDWPGISALRLNSGRGSFAIARSQNDPQPGTSESAAHIPEESGDNYTVEEAIEKLGFGRFQWGMLGYVGLIWFADAMELMMLSFIGPAVRGEFSLDSNSESVLTSCVFVGMILGSSFWGALSDTRGRRPAFLFTALGSAAFAYLSAAAPNFWTLLAMRTMLGIGLAGTTIGDTLFLEVIPKSQRGRWMMALGLFWTMGSISEAALAWWLLSDYGWRVLLAASATPLALLLLLFPLLPESPRYLIAKGQTDAAEKVLQRIAQVNGKTLPVGRLISTAVSEVSDRATLVIGEVNKNVEGASAALQRLGRDMFTAASRLLAPQLRTTTMLLTSTWLLNMMGYYGVVLLATEIHLSPEAAAGAADAAAGASNISLTSEDFKNILITSAGELPALFVALAGMELIGRRSTIAIALGGCALATALLTTDPSGSYFTALMFSGRLLISVAFNTLMVYTKELYPTSLRSLGLGTCNAIGRAGGMIAPFIVIKLCHGGQAHTAELILAGFCGVAALAVSLVSRETLGAPLADTEEEQTASGGESGTLQEKTALL